MIPNNTMRSLIYDNAYDFLVGRVGTNVLKKHLEYYSICSPVTVQDVYRQMLQSLKNKQGYVNFIADVNGMKSIVQSFEPQSVVNKFENDWQKLFHEFKIEYGKHYRMDINNPKNAWVMYSKGALSCAYFLSHFQSLKEFDKFVRSFFLNEFTIAALPMLLEKEIFGFGFSLACDFLKELGYGQYGKPDVHLKDIFLKLNLVESRSDYEIFKEIVKIGICVGKDPVVVDKVFWLIGSGNFHFSGIKINGLKPEFIAFMKKEFKIGK